MNEFTWNEIQVLRGLIFQALDQEPDKYTKADLLSSLEKLDERRIELQLEMRSE